MTTTAPIAPATEELSTDTSGWYHEASDPEVGVSGGWIHEDCLVEPDCPEGAEVTTDSDEVIATCADCRARVLLHVYSY